MKTYHGHYKHETVTVEDHATGTISRLVHHVRFSPDGFLWGYNGSAPAELARCLLIDALGQAAWGGKASDLTSDLVEKLTGPFKEQVISRLDRYSDWNLTQSAILTFVRQEASLLGIPISEPLGVPKP